MTKHTSSSSSSPPKKLPTITSPPQVHIWYFFSSWNLHPPNSYLYLFLTSIIHSWKSQRQRFETPRMMSEVICWKPSGSAFCSLSLDLIALCPGMELLWRKLKQKKPKKISRGRWCSYCWEWCFIPGVKHRVAICSVVFDWIQLYKGLSDVATILARRVAVEFSDSDDGPSDSEYDSDDWGRVHVFLLICLCFVFSYFKNRDTQLSHLFFINFFLVLKSWWSGETDAWRRSRALVHQNAGTLQVTNYK